MDSASAFPPLGVRATWLYARELALVILLVGEILVLTVSFDTQPLFDTPGAWATFLGWSSQYLRLAVAILVAVLLVGGRPLWSSVEAAIKALAVQGPVSAGWAVIHAGAFVAFAVTTRSLFAQDDVITADGVVWTAVWCVLGALTISSAALLLLPAAFWSRLGREHRGVLLWGSVAGTVVWASGFVTETFWAPLARYTFALVTLMLGAIYPETVSQPERLIVGTSGFRVEIAATCSGYEGVGLIVAFLSIYLYLFRKDLRFPAALVLLPVGAATIWLLNAVRIVVLIAIGTSGWPAVATGGFHSQAGWLVFNAVGLGFVALINGGGYFLRHPPVHAILRTAARSGVDSTTACLGPFVTMLAAAMITSAFSAGFDWLYPLKLVAVAGVIWSCRGAYAGLNWSVSSGAVAVGVVTFMAWIAMLPADLVDKDGWPAALQSLPAAWGGVWLALRLVGYILVTPIAEELAFRAYATRRVIGADIDRVPVGAFTWPSFLISSAIFGAFHGALWLPGTMAGMAFAFALYRRRSFGDAVLAHATTNGLIACYVFYTGRWSVWS